jgi:polar amino acid transport system substrate-binding protein
MNRLMLACLTVVLAAMAPTLTFSAEPADQKPVLRTGFVDFPPFKYVDKEGNAAGPWVDMTEAVAAEAGYKVDWVHLPIARVYLYLRTGRIDFWPGVANIPQIRGSVYESAATPMRVVLYAFHQKHVEPPEDLTSLEGTPLIMINGYSYLGALRELSLNESDLSYAPGHQSALRMLELGRGQYLLDYDEPVQAVKHLFPALDLTGTPIFQARGAFIVSRANPDAEIIVRKFDDAYKRLTDSGQLQALQ